MSDKLDAMNWQAVIETILNVSSLKYELEVTEESLIIRADRQSALEIEASLQAALKTPKDFFGRLPYNITTEAVVSDVAQEQLTTLEIPNVTLEDTVEEGKKVLSLLFGDDAFDELALNKDVMFAVAQGAKSENYVLYSKPARTKENAKAWHSDFEALFARLNNVDVAILRNVWAGQRERSPLNATLPNLGSSDDTRFKGLIQECFGIIESGDSNKEVRLYLNYGLLYRFIFPPKIEINRSQVASSSSQSVIIINKKHFLNYMQQLTQGGCLLRAYKQGEEEQSTVIGRPIFFADKKFGGKPHKHTIIVDCSGSMEGYINELGRHIRGFLDRLKSFDANARVNIVPFGGDTTRKKLECSIAESWKIEPFITNLTATGRTPLFSTVQQVLTGLAQDAESKRFIHTIILFTDGEDTTYNKATAGAMQHREMSLQEIHKILRTMQDQFAVKIFPMGFGNCDNDALNATAQQVNTPYIHLASIDDFTHIYQYQDEFTYDEQLLKVLVQAGDVSQFEIPLILSGNAHSPGLLIPFHDKAVRATIGNKGITVILDETRQLPVASVYDQLIELLIKSADIVVANIVDINEKPNIDEKILKLQEIIALVKNIEVQRQHKLTTTEAIAITKALDKIGYYLIELTKFKNSGNVALYQSLQSIAAHNLGYRRVKVTMKPIAMVERQAVRSEQAPTQTLEEQVVRSEQAPAQILEEQVVRSEQASYSGLYNIFAHPATFLNNFMGYLFNSYIHNHQQSSAIVAMPQSATTSKEQHPDGLETRKAKSCVLL